MTPHGFRRIHYAWVVLGATAVVLLAASGVRSAFGVFIKPMDLLLPPDGSAVGALAGGYFYDRLGDYTMAFHSAALVAFAATLMVLAIRERPVSRRPPEVVVVASAPGV